MIKERYVSSEVALLLKDKGFNEDYPKGDCTQYGCTQQMACDWIEKKHHYIIDVHLDVESEEASSWVWSVYERINVEGKEPYARLYFEDDEPYEFDNQEFAYNDALKYVLTNLV